MQLQIKSSNGIALVPVESRLLAQRRIFLEGEITPEMANEFMKSMMYLIEVDNRAEIHVFINSEGGDLVSGLQIYDILQHSKVPVNLYCTGKAYSMAAVLLAGGAPGRRYILPHSKVMLHEPLLGNKIQGNSSSIKSISDSLLESKLLLNGILAKHTGKSEKEIEWETRYDHYFTAEESKEFHLVDKIINFDEMV